MDHRPLDHRPLARARLAVQFTALYAGIPLLIATIRRPGLLFAALWGGGLAIWLITRRWPHTTPNPGRTPGLRRVALRFAILAPLLTLIVARADPHHFLNLPREKPILWIAIMILYPALSVIPQELIYRRFLFARYAPLYGAGPAMIAASAIAFGFGHIIFLNLWAVLLTLAGGGLFATTYARTNALRTAAIEHALYGCLVFTIGLGRFFYTGSAWH